MDAAVLTSDQLECDVKICLRDRPDNGILFLPPGELQLMKWTRGSLDRALKLVLYSSLCHMSGEERHAGTEGDCPVFAVA